MNRQPKIVVDQNMPGIEQLFGGIAEISRQDGRLISADTLKDADALLCRSITKVNSELLQNSKVKFVGTATIGTDHLDVNWLESHNIHWSNAAGCNAAAVAQYVLSAIAYWTKSSPENIKKRGMHGCTVGIVGAGNVGTELARCLDLLNIQYLLCDPPLENAGDKREFVDMEDILQCDIMTLHVPIGRLGDHATHHLVSTDRLCSLNQNQLLINSSRGAVVDNQALSEYLDQPNHAQVVLDVYEDEPNVPQFLLEQCLITTPHIAGHTLEGKLRGSWMIYRAFCQAFGLQRTRTEGELYPRPNEITLKTQNLTEQLLTIYNIEADSECLKQHSVNSIAERFDKLRKNATQLPNGRIRRDYSGWHFQGDISLAL